MKKGWKEFEESLNYLGAGSSTNSKIPKYEDFEPALIVKGKGCRIWDLDGNEYIDFRNGLGPVTIGYNIEEINEAIIKQLSNGIVFGHPSPLEGEVAKKIVEVIPCAEKVRFLKTGGEAIAACIKIARAYTGKDKILHCGYNGWLNNLSRSKDLPPGILSTRPENGVPSVIQDLHENLPWGEIKLWEEKFKREKENIAACVIASSYPEIEKGKDFLPRIRELTEKYGILMIMDEIVTGFRVAIGGVSEYFNFKPDLAVFSKGIANGMPLSVYLGKRELIDMADKIGISSTFGGETLSLAAAKATIDFYIKNNVISHLWRIGKIFQDRINEIFNKYGIKASLIGFPVCCFFSFENIEEKDLFFKLCYKNGVSLYNVVYVNYSHKEKDIEEAVEKIEIVVKEMKDGNY